MLRCAQHDVLLLLPPPLDGLFCETLCCVTAKNKSFHFLPLAPVCPHFFA